MGIPIVDAAQISLALQQIQKQAILHSFFSDMQYGPSGVDLVNVELERFMRSEMESRKIQCVQLERTLHLAASLIELGYYDLSLAEKKNIALFNWYLIYVDDMSTTDPVALSQFERRFLRGQPQLNPVLTALVEVLMKMWDLYDELSANSIVSATFEFITSNCIEPELEKSPLAVEGVRRLPWFMREKSGVATAFALQIFTKSGNFKMMEILKALPDMYYWIDLTNDLLSFHKEDLAGERGNYVGIRANAEQISPLKVLEDMADELRTSREIIHAALSQNPRALAGWKRWETGYVQWHVMQSRYKLRDLGFSDSSSWRPMECDAANKPLGSQG